MIKLQTGNFLQPLFGYFFLMVLIGASGCKTYTKEDYLGNYQSFILKIKNGHRDFQMEDWEKLDKENEKFFNREYKRFAGELKPHEYIRIQRFNFLYQFYRGEINIAGLLSGKYNDVFKGISIEMSDIIHEFSLILKDYEYEKKSVIIRKLIG